MKNTIKSNGFFGTLTAFTRKILGTERNENSISSFMSAMIDEQNDAYEKEFASFSSEYMYGL